jgi:[ribosomal protein S5]-alanine N-acetyltransferase
LYSTLWTVILKEAEIMVADICITEEPKATGVIEIVYGTYRQFQGKGIMTEAVGGIINWAISQPEILSIIDSTDKENTASSAILLRNNFEITSETESVDSWELKINNIHE